MIYDQDDPAVAPDVVQCDANVGKIFSVDSYRLFGMDAQ